MLFIDKGLMEVFKVFLDKTGGFNISYPRPSRYSPCMTFNWRGSDYWVYEIGQSGNFEIQGKPLKPLNDLWEATVLNAKQEGSKREADQKGKDNAK